MQRTFTTFASFETLETRTLLSGTAEFTAALIGHGPQHAQHAQARTAKPANPHKQAGRPSAPPPSPSPARKVTPAPKPTPAPARRPRSPRRPPSRSPRLPRRLRPWPPPPRRQPCRPSPRSRRSSDKALHYQAFSSAPLFAAAGPSENDINQGEVGDCYFLSTLSAVAKTDPARIRNRVSDLGDGTYLVRFSRNGAEVDVRVDDQLPVFANGTPGYARLGQQSSLWVAIMEKAFAVFRTGGDSYASLDSGWMDEAFAALALRRLRPARPRQRRRPAGLDRQPAGGGKAVTYADNAPADGAPLIASHAYTVDAIVTDA